MRILLCILLTFISLSSYATNKKPAAFKRIYKKEFFVYGFLKQGKKNMIVETNDRIFTLDKIGFLLLNNFTEKSSFRQQKYKISSKSIIKMELKKQKEKR